jgi:squamous cell carcinoma antigen recognized by T-cells 3
MSSELFSRALATNVLDKEVEQIVPLFLARAGFERRQIESSKVEADQMSIDEDSFAALVGVLETGIEILNKGSVPSISHVLELTRP